MFWLVQLPDQVNQPKDTKCMLLTTVYDEEGLKRMAVGFVIVLSSGRRRTSRNDRVQRRRRTSPTSLTASA